MEGAKVDAGTERFVGKVPLLVTTHKSDRSPPSDGMHLPRPSSESKLLQHPLRHSELTEQRAQSPRRLWTPFFAAFVCCFGSCTFFLACLLLGFRIRGLLVFFSFCCALLRSLFGILSVGGIRLGCGSCQRIAPLTLFDLSFWIGSTTSPPLTTSRVYASAKSEVIILGVCASNAMIVPKEAKVTRRSIRRAGTFDSYPSSQTSAFFLIS